MALDEIGILHTKLFLVFTISSNLLNLKPSKSVPNHAKSSNILGIAAGARYPKRLRGAALEDSCAYVLFAACRSAGVFQSNDGDHAMVLELINGTFLFKIKLNFLILILFQNFKIENSIDDA